LSGKEYEDQCLANHSSLDKMEVDAMKTMFSRSEEKFQIYQIYTNYVYIGDGDSKTYKAISDLKPYVTTLL